ncbi:MAG: LysR substrate-binding domain-containing protein [Lautropia sp.]
MRRRLPPLYCLTALESVAELGSFTRAGEALALTHSAVSHQIRQLEEHLGVRLLERLPRRVVLTPEGAIYLAEVKRALKQLEAAEQTLKDHLGTRPLRIGVLSSFAGNLLVPELKSFMTRHPDIRVEIDARPDIERDEDADIDVFIRYGKGDWAGFQAVKLLPVSLFPVCSPAYLARHGPFDDVEDLSRAVLLRHTREPWDAWLAAVAARGNAIVDAVMPAGPVYTDARLMLDAACDGHGVALARSPLAATDLREGRLVRICDVEVASTDAYFAYHRPFNRHQEALQLFLDWLVHICERVHRNC